LRTLAGIPAGRYPESTVPDATIKNHGTLDVLPRGEVDHG
jgi:hypothetical protein